MLQTTRTAGRGGDVLLAGCVVADGSGEPVREADVLLDGDVIAAVEPQGGIGADGYDRRDLSGLTLAPGFIDVHSHADNAPLLAEDDTTKILQGVTVEVVGNCGFSLAPVPDRRDELEALTSRIFPAQSWGWSSFAELLSRLDDRGYVTGYAPLVGHGTLRIAVAGFENRVTTTAERRRMVELGTAARQAGAFGLSTGLIYPPGLFSDTDEIIEVMTGLPQGTIYATHMRGEGAHLRRSIAEALEIGRRSGAPVQISHLKSSGRQNWGGVAGALELIENARADGVRVTQDVYPYTASSTMLTACLPPWCQEGGNTAVLERLADAEQLRKLRDDLEGGPSEEWENQVAGAGWDGVLVASTGSHTYEGQTLAELGEELGSSPFEALVTVLTQERLRASMVVFSMCEDDLELALRDPFTMIGSDGLPPGVGGKPHPRLFGTFPRVLARYVRDRKTLDLATAIHKMTGLPADTFGLHDRGRIAPGHVADLVAFADNTIADHGDYRDPVHPPTGLAWVMQAGDVVVDNGRWLGVRRGQRLLPSAA
jgi:N-acyl-D-aspartate/D-glutamate deacylase